MPVVSQAVKNKQGNVTIIAFALFFVDQPYPVSLPGNGVALGRFIGLSIPSGAGGVLRGCGREDAARFDSVISFDGAALGPPPPPLPRKRERGVRFGFGVFGLWSVSPSDSPLPLAGEGRGWGPDTRKPSYTVYRVARQPCTSFHNPNRRHRKHRCRRCVGCKRDRADGRAGRDGEPRPRRRVGRRPAGLPACARAAGRFARRPRRACRSWSPPVTSPPAPGFPPPGCASGWPRPPTYRTGSGATIAAFAGEVTTEPIRQQVRPSRGRTVTAPSAALGMAFALPPSQRAMTVALDPADSSRPVRPPRRPCRHPGDRRAGGSGPAEARTVLQNVRLLAVGAQTAPDAAPSPPTSGPAHVTVAVSPAQAQALILAAARGKIHLTLACGR